MPHGNSPKVTRPAVSIPVEIAEQLQEFSRRTGIPMARITAAALHKFLPKLLSGEASIVNGEYVELSDRTA